MDAAEHEATHACTRCWHALLCRRLERPLPACLVSCAAACMKLCKAAHVCSGCRPANCMAANLCRRGPHCGSDRGRRTVDVGQWAAGAAGTCGRAAQRPSEDGDAAGATRCALQARAVSVCLTAFACRDGISKLLPMPVTLALHLRFPTKDLRCPVTAPASHCVCPALAQGRERQNRGRQLRHLRHIRHHCRWPCVHIWPEQLRPTGSAGCAHGQGTVAPATARECVHMAQRLLASLQPPRHAGRPSQNHAPPFPS